ncbi:MAG: hypothetical protein WCK35_16760 [Chloroflexota bacterium]
MDPRVLAEKKGLVIARIEAGLDMLVSKGFAGAHADELRAAVAARNEPLLNEFKRLAVIADLIDDLAMEMVERLAGGDVRFAGQIGKSVPPPAAVIPKKDK